MCVCVSVCVCVCVLISQDETMDLGKGLVEFLVAILLSSRLGMNTNLVCHSNSASFFLLLDQLPPPRVEGQVNPTIYP